MKKHINTLGILNIVFGIMGLFAGVVVLMFLAGLGVFASVESGEEEAILLFGLIATIFMAVTLVSSVPFIIAGIGLRKKRPWARILTIILAALNLLSFPLGTALGVYALWVLTNQEVVNEFENPSIIATPQTA